MINNFSGTTWALSRTDLERVDELEAANQLLTGQLQEKEVLHLLRHR